MRLKNAFYIFIFTFSFLKMHFTFLFYFLWLLLLSVVLVLEPFILLEYITVNYATSSNRMYRRLGVCGQWLPAQGLSSLARFHKQQKLHLRTNAWDVPWENGVGWCRLAQEELPRQSLGALSASCTCRRNTDHALFRSRAFYYPRVWVYTVLVIPQVFAFLK